MLRWTCLVLFFASITVNAKNSLDKLNSVVIDSSHLGVITMKLDIKNSYRNWGIGFFMLTRLIDPAGGYRFTICDDDNNCENLQVLDRDGIAQTTKQFIRPKLSNGHVPILSPQHPFPLKANKSYTVSILNLKSDPQNITAMPQKVFLYNVVTGEVNNISQVHYEPDLVHETENHKLFDERISKRWQIESAGAEDANDLIIPTPKRIISYPGDFLKPEIFKVYGLDTLRFGFKALPLKITLNQVDSNINLVRCNRNMIDCNVILTNPEGYNLQIRSNRITIYANNQTGWFYALETLAQLNYETKNKIRNQSIIDYPRFKYRGIMLDVVRHFFTVDDIKKLIDIMALQKLNTLHLHLADDEGWRLMLDGYPELTAFGASRNFKNRNGASNLIDDKYDITNYKHKVYVNVDNEYSGFYTKAQIKELIRYANNHSITIIPEIEMPGHARALKKALPDLFFDPTDLSKYYTVQGYNDNILPICQYRQNKRFTNNLNKIIQNTSDIFANQTTIYAINNEISLSGDEVDSRAFSNYPLCNNIDYQGLNSSEISHKFFKNISTLLPKYKLSGWHELLLDESYNFSKYSIAESHIGHIWQWQPSNNQTISGVNLAKKLTSHGYPVVVDFPDLLYFDLRYSELWDEPGLYWAAGYTDTYSALSSANVVTTKNDNLGILGLEGAIWSELIPSSEHLFYMLLPKSSGLAEAAWSNQNQISWHNLAYKLGCGNDRHFLDYLWVNYNVRYRGYPNGIIKEIPKHTLCHN